MRVFVTYEGERHSIDVLDTMTVSDVKQVVRDKFNMGPDPGPGGMGTERKILALHAMGADLADDWIFYDVGIKAGATVRVLMKDEVKPVLYLYTAYNGETVPILDKLQVPTLKVSELRSIATRTTGMPIGVFRMVSPGGQEMYDCNTLYEYGLEHGDTLRLETWDGWNDFLNLCIMGFTSHVLGLLSSDELLARYQMKVAMYLAAHYGHVDLAVSLLRQGIRADEVVGDHPSRTWCREAYLHVDALKTPVHVSSEQGQLGVLRSYVHHNVCNVLAKDGNDLTPLNIALRKKQKPCASFLLTKQWSKINYTNKTIPLNIFVKMKRWSERSKDKVLIIHGQWKSSIKNPKRHLVTGSLVGHGVFLDGFSNSKMTSKPTQQLRAEEEAAAFRRRQIYGHLESTKNAEINPETYFKSVSMAQSLKLPKLNKLNTVFKNMAADRATLEEESESDSDTSSETENVVRLPPITGTVSRVSRKLSLSHQNITAGTRQEPEFRDNPNRGARPQSRSSYIQTGQTRDNKTASKQEVHDKPRKKKKKDFAGDLLAQARAGENGMLLPMVSVDAPRPFCRSSAEDLTRQTLTHYERYRGLKSRDYAIKCLSVANSFKEKPWLHQVRQAMSISAQGVRKTVSRRAHLFTHQSHDEPLQSAAMKSQSLLETQSKDAVMAE